MDSAATLETAAGKQAKLTLNLNRKLKASSSGVLLRAIPDNPGTPYVPSSWTRNDIRTPNSMYLVQNPWCGPRAQDTPFQAYTLNGPWDDGAFVRDICGKYRKQNDGVKPWTNTFAMAQAGLVSTKVNKFTAKTFYPTDSNASDGRAAFTGLDGIQTPPITTRAAATDTSGAVPATRRGGAATRTTVRSIRRMPASLARTPHWSAGTTVAVR